MNGCKGRHHRAVKDTHGPLLGGRGEAISGGREVATSPLSKQTRHQGLALPLWTSAHLISTQPVRTQDCHLDMGRQSFLGQPGPIWSHLKETEMGSGHIK